MPGWADRGPYVGQFHGVSQPMVSQQPTWYANAWGGMAGPRVTATSHYWQNHVGYAQIGVTQHTIICRRVRYPEDAGERYYFGLHGTPATPDLDCVIRNAADNHRHALVSTSELYLTDVPDPLNQLHTGTWIYNQAGRVIFRWDGVESYNAAWDPDLEANYRRYDAQTTLDINSALPGTIFSLLYYNRALSNSECAQAEAWLAATYPSP